MNIEEIERILLTVAENQAETAANMTRITADIGQIDGQIATVLNSQNRYEAMLARQGEILHSLADRQLKTDEHFADLATAQTGQESRLVRLETAFQQVAQSLQLLIEMTATHEERLDAGDEARVHTDARLDALIDSQIALGQRFDQMAEKFDRMGERFDQMLVRAEAHDRQIEQLAMTQSEHSAVIRMLIERGGN